MILFVDDEPRRMEAYIEELRERGHLVNVVRDAESAWIEFSTMPTTYDLVVLDIMMLPTGSFEGENTEAGARTGLRLYERMRRVVPTLRVAVLTNVTDERVLQEFSREPLCEYFRKIDYLPYEFALEIDRLLAS